MPQPDTGGHREGRLYYRDDSPKIWAKYYDADGNRRRRSTGTTDWEQARAVLRKWEQEAFLGQHFDVPAAKTFDELMVAFLDENPERNEVDDNVCLRHLHPVFTGRDIHELSPVDVRKYVRQRRKEGAAAATVNHEIGLLSKAINHARLEWGLKVDNPCAGCRLPEPEGRVRWLTHDEAEALIEAASKVPKAPHLADFVQLALFTGMRKGELLGLEWSRVDLERGLIYLEARHQKGKRRAVVPLNQRAREAIESRRRWVAEHCPETPWVFTWRSGKRITDVKNGFRTALAKAGITDCRIHDLRHTFASWLVMEGVDLYRVRDLLRHRSITETERYAHLAPDLAAEAASTLDRVGGKAGNESAGAGALVQN